MANIVARLLPRVQPCVLIPPPPRDSTLEVDQIPWNRLKRFISSIVILIGPLILHQNEKFFKRIEGSFRLATRPGLFMPRRFGK